MMNDIISIKILRTSSVLVEFLQEEDYFCDFKKKFKAQEINNIS